MTDAKGRMFISYSRKRLNDVTKIVRNLTEHGVPVWQDIKDLSHRQTEDEIRSVLRDPDIAGAVMYITPEVANSVMIKNVEAPEIVRRAVADKDFVFVPIAAGGLDYGDVGGVFEGYIGATDLSTWNILRVNSNPLNQRGAVEISRRVLGQRIQVIHRRLPNEEALPIQFAVRQPLPHTNDFALTVDWSRHFDGRHAEADAWKKTLLPSIRNVISNIEQKSPRRRIEASGNPTLSAALALGVVCLAPRGIGLVWKQNTQHPQNKQNLPLADWSLSNRRENSGLSDSTKSLNVSASDLALLISINDNIEPDFSRVKSSLPPLRASVHVADFQQEKVIRRRNLTPGEATDAAHIIIETLRNTRTQYNARGTVHLFMSAPLGLAVMVGQLLNTFGEIITYEHAPGGPLPYIRETILKP